MELTVKLDVPHNATDWDWHQWVYVGDYVMRDSIGRRNPNGYKRWLVVRCNNTECSGVAIVYANDLENEVERRFPVPPNPDRKDPNK